MGCVDRSGDMFAQFLASLARHMDDHQLRGGELAAELFVSRSLLDRLVKASAGEPPARFRRRLLLERAAFQLRATGTSIIDAAAQAGYSCHEAFTRAFQRAYGAPPSSWRSSGRGINIASPSGVHFYPPGGLRLPARAGVTPVNFTAELIDHHVSLLEQLLDRAGELTDGQLDAAIELPVQGIDDNPTIRSLLSRLVGQLEMWNAAMASEPYDFQAERHETLESMHRRLNGPGRAFARYVRQASEHDRFDETFVDATGRVPYVFTAAGMIAHVLTYAAYRRTLVAGALASAGTTELDDDPLTWFRP
jgi:AraC family transcriptional regulator